MKKRMFCLLITVFFMLSGCTFSAQIDTLMSPPTLTKQQEDIYNALIASVGSNIKLRYPKSGSWLSAFVVHNLDEEPTDEAIVFYERTGIAAGESTLRINVLDQIDGKWRSVYDHSATGADVERVFLSTLGESSEINIIVGFSLVAENDKAINIYTYSDGILTMTYGDSYSTAQVVDLDGSGKKRLLLISGVGSARASQAKTISIDSSGVYVISSVPLSDASAEFVQVTYGKLTDTAMGIYVDSNNASGGIQTELLYINDEVLTNVFYQDDAENKLLTQTIRPEGYLSADIDGDGVVEIPVAQPIHDQIQNSESEVYLTRWMAYENGMLYCKYRSYYSTYSNFCFIFPDLWGDNVKVDVSAVGEVIFLDTQTEAEILRLVAVSKADIYAKEREGFTLIFSKSETGYLAKLPSEKNSFTPSIAEIALLLKIW